MKNTLIFPMLLTAAYLGSAVLGEGTKLLSKSGGSRDDYRLSGGRTGDPSSQSEPLGKNSSAYAAYTLTFQQTVKDTAANSFVSKAAIGGMKEVNLGKIAVEKASNPRVKAFGAMMVKDHTAANEELKQLATANKVPMLITNMAQDTGPLPDQQGPGFDLEYMNMMIADHQKTISLFQTAAARVKITPIRAFAERTLPKLQMHLDSARAIYSSLRGARP